MLFKLTNSDIVFSLFVQKRTVIIFFPLQRGSDELLSQSGAVSNGSAMSPQPHHAADNNNEAKKVSLFFKNKIFFAIFN